LVAIGTHDCFFACRLNVATEVYRMRFESNN
jgi:hypothetical protein